MQILWFTYSFNSQNVFLQGYRSGVERGSTWWPWLSKRSCSWLIHEILALYTQSGPQQNEQNSHTPGTWPTWRGQSHQWWVTCRLDSFLEIFISCEYVFIYACMHAQQIRKSSLDQDICVQKQIFKNAIHLIHNSGYLQFNGFFSVYRYETKLWFGCVYWCCESYVR